MESLLNILKKIDPSTLDYQEWINVGMALKHEGFTAADWDSWSQSDSRYHAGECEQKWQGFNGSAEPVTAGTIIQMAKDRGLTFGGDFRELDWDSEISYEEGAPTVNTGEGIPIHEPENFDPVNEIVTYLETLFEAGDNVGYVTETWESEDKGKRRYLPTKGACDRTAGELIQQLKSCGGDIGAVLGDYKTEAGAWIRFNPLDGKGVKNENVTEYRYALVESDSMPIAQQHAVIRELELPVAVLVYSGGKSLHAIVRIDAPNYDEYRKRVDYLYKICKENGLDIDRVTSWVEELDVTEELVNLAFKENEYRSNLALVHVGETLKKWHDQGVKTAEDAARFSEEEHKENKRNATRRKAKSGSVWRTGEEAGIASAAATEAPAAKAPEEANNDDDIPDDILDMFGDADEDN